MRHKALTFFLSLLPLAALADATRLRVALFDVVPYASSASSGPMGIYVDWVREFLGSQGLGADITLMPFPRIPLALKHQEADLTISFSTEALDEAAEPLGPVLRVDSVVVTRLDRPATRMQQLNGGLIGRIRGGCRDLADRTDLSLRWIDLSALDKGLRMLSIGRLDGVCLTRDVMRHYLPVLGIERAQLGPEVVIGQRTAMLFARRDLEPHTLSTIRAAFAARKPLQRD